MFISSLIFISSIKKLANKTQANSEGCDYFYNNIIEMSKQEIILLPCYK